MINPLKDLLDFIYPRVCHVCGTKLADHERFACTLCLSRLPRTGYHRRPMNPMEERFAGQFRFNKATAHFFYARHSDLATLIHDMKYRRFPGIGEMFGRIMARELFSTGFFNDIEIVVPVPMHFIKKARRGYNQSAIIAEGIAKEIGIETVDALRMTRMRGTQTKLGTNERLANAKDLFRIAKPDKTRGRGILLVDDVCTTGATLGAAALALDTQGSPSCLNLLTVGVTF